MKKQCVAILASLSLSLVASSAYATPIKAGGKMIVTYKDDVSTLDPAIGYDWQNWSMIKSLFDGLMDYETGTTVLKTDLAKSYKISDDGLVYTFELREGVKFHNGREMTAEDVKYSIERTMNPKTQSPGAGFFASIAGFDEMSSAKETTASGIKVVGKYSISFTLSRPDATFLHVLALNFASIVPKEAVAKYKQDFGKHPVGTGAYSLSEWSLGQRLVFTRNQNYHVAGIPYMNEIEFQVGQDPNVALLRLERGEVDLAGDGIPPAKFLEVKNSPMLSKLVVEGGQLHTGYITLNTRMKPFDQLAVREAVNMAVNKARIIRMINGRAVAANQPLPPTMPGYDKNYQGFKYDPQGAIDKLAAAGFKDGFSTELYVMNTDPQPRIAQAIQQDLKKIGVTVSIKSLAQANVIAAGGEVDQAPMIWSGGMAWIADFPDPSNFYGPILGCAGAVQGGWNWAWYCNEALDKRAIAADSMTDASQATAREQVWREIFIEAQKDAPWVPIFNEQRFTIKSARLGGDDAIFVDPVHIPVNYDHVYDKDVQ
ncbi:MAG: ABC transporter substrate-binding protein [Oceanospirillaceae bacterium]